MGEIQVVYTTSGKGICPECGNGLWGGPPCEHKRKREQDDKTGSGDL